MSAEGHSVAAMAEAKQPRRMTEEERAELTVRRAAAFFASLLISPGAGQLALGRRWRGLFWLALGVFTVLPGPLISIWAFYANLPLRLLAGIDAALLRPPHARVDDPLAGMPRWVTVLGFWCALMAATFGLKLLAPRFYVGVIAGDATMAPTIAIDEQVLVRTGADPARGDVVAIRTSKEGHVTFARVIALPRQTIALRSGRAHVDGTALARGHFAPNCSYRRPTTNKTKKKGASDQAQRGPSDREERPCKAVLEENADARYTIIIAATTQTADEKARVLASDELWVWGDNRLEAPAPRVIKRHLALGCAKSIWWARGPGGLDWQRIGQRLR